MKNKAIAEDRDRRAATRFLARQQRSYFSEQEIQRVIFRHELEPDEMQTAEAKALDILTQG